MNNNWSIYKHTCPNGKVYIGITSRNPIDRWNNGNGYRLNCHFSNAIHKYGWDNIKHEILLTNLSKEEAQNSEKALIALHKSNNANYGYNHSAGGEGKSGFVPTAETREKIRNSLCGTHRPREVKEKLSKSHKGKKLTEEHKEHIRKGCSGINSKKVICVTTNIIYNSTIEASKATGIHRNSISSCCRNESKYGGKLSDGTKLIWKYCEVI